MRPYTLLTFFLCTIISVKVHSQEKQWTLQECIAYALDHNISIKQDSLNTLQSDYTLKQSQLSQIPSLNISGSYGRSYGRSINPTTNQFVEGSYDFLGPSASTSALLFGWSQVRNTIQKNRYSLKAAIANHQQLKNDVALNVANSYLAALLSKEQIKISESQVKVSIAQLSQTKAFVASGRLPELNLAQLESQVAADSSNLITAIANYNSALLDLKTLLNIELSSPFDITVPQQDVNSELYATLSENPESIFNYAKSSFGSILSSQYSVISAEKGLAAAKSGLWPQLSLSYQVSTNFANNSKTYKNPKTTVEQLPYFAIDSASAKSFPIYGYSQSFDIVNTPFSTQIENNLRQTIALSVNIPIFNGWQTQFGIKQAKINLERQRLTAFNTELTLKQNVYKAYNNALSSKQKYEASKRSYESASRALEFAQKRYDLGLTSTVDLLVTQNTQFSSASNLLLAKYDLIFKLKVLDYYLGKQIKL